MVKFRDGNGSAFLCGVLYGVLFRVKWLLVALFICGQSASLQAAADWRSGLAQAALTQPEITLFRVAGSNTVGEKLAPALISAFLQQAGFTDVQVVAEAGRAHSRKVLARLQQGEQSVVVAVPVAAHGSSTGFRALLDGSADLGASSRPVKDTEVSQLASLGAMRDLGNEHIVAIDGLAVIVHQDNPVSKLPLESVRDIFSGKITQWSAVGGRSAPIRLHARDDNSGTYDTFKHLVLAGAAVSAKARRYESNDDLSAQVQADVDAIGFVALPSIGAAKALALSDGEALALAPSEMTVATEDYPLSRRLYFYSASGGALKPVVAEFLAFVHSDAGQAVVAESGYVAQALYALAMKSEDGRLAGMQRMNLNIRFQDGSSALDNKSRLDVERLAHFLAQPGHRDSRITLVGFSNPLAGTGRATLSRLRAQNVRWALRSEGIRNPISALAGNAVSVSDPASLNADRNRRVEIWIQ
ncbi:substrate-binding domain-containing protein [Ketobacter sp.]|uniref:substrate-binding domain-containing protein n=1 Tax=Ketobacter sp. TaxID=2083498 RepID=UPI000F1FE89C|nr:substrate-binding domain-containing protein [Ketobacter sp.]RLU01101.1 MAG: hypothetical protein D9N14_03895 [Ketobacter sp.]